MKLIRVSNITHSFYKHVSIDLNCNLETVIEVTLAHAMNSDTQLIVRQIIASMKKEAQAPTIEKIEVEATPAPKTKIKRTVARKNDEQNALKPETLIELWNSLADPKLSRCATLNSTREQKIKKRLKDFPKLESWKSAIENLNRWPWGLGENSTGWKASLDYLISEKGIKCFEGSLSGKVTRKNAQGGIDFRDAGYQGDDDAILKAFEQGENCESF